LSIPHLRLCEFPRDAAHRYLYQEIFMKSITKAILVTSFVFTAQVAVAADSAFPGSDPDEIGLPANETYKSEHAKDPVPVTGAAFPGSDPDEIGLPAKETYKSEHAADSRTHD